MGAVEHSRVAALWVQSNSVSGAGEDTGRESQ